MAVIRFVDPLAGLSSLHDQVNSLFNNTFGSVGAGAGTGTTDVYSTDEGLTVEAHLPNFKDRDISVSQHEGALEIKAEHTEKEEEKDKNRKYLIRESAVQYYRRFALPRNADADNIQAKFEDGILKVTVPYKELPKPKHIAIKAKNK